jgi:hypothetical protein
MAVVILLGLLGLTPADRFWALDGLSPLPSDPEGPRAWLLARGLGGLAGWVMWTMAMAVTGAMLVGWRSDAAVLGTFLILWLQTLWNRYPLSSAHQVAIVVVFCLIWANTGLVWSADARRRNLAGKSPVGAPSTPIWPLRIIRYQVALIYLSSALWKLLYPSWRDGTAAYWAINLNGFHRFPVEIPVAFEPVFYLLTWSTVLFELFFPLLVWFRATRVPCLIAGIGLHLGLFLALELGPFSWAMIATYVAFLDPEWVAQKAGLHIARLPAAAAPPTR